MEIPARVRRAERRAEQIGFQQSSNVNVGRLLAVLAGGVRPGGRVLEIGTGAGFGLAWIVAGLGSRSDVEVVSVELDPETHAAVVADEWPAWARLVQGDILERYDDLGAFSLIFADAQGGKWQRLDRTISALEPSGLLVVDDMRRPTVEIVPDQAEQTARVRSTLLSDPRLLPIELDWATGLILARRVDRSTGADQAEPRSPRLEPHSRQRTESDWLEDILRWARAHDDIRAVVLTGSRARGERVDEWSDYDVEIFTTEPGRYESCDWAAEIAPIWVCLPLTREDDARYRMRLTVFEGGTKVDFAMAPLELLAELVERGRLSPVYERGYRVLLDRDGLASGLPPSTGRAAALERPDEATFRAVVTEFWFEATQIPGYLARDELWVVKHRDWTMKLMLLRMLEWCASTTGGGGADGWEIGRRMVEWLPADLYRHVGDGFGRWDGVDAWRALLATCDLFRDVSRRTATVLGFASPASIDEPIWEYVLGLAARTGPP